MARLYINKSQTPSRIAWMYVLQTKAPISIHDYKEDEADVCVENLLKVTPFLIDGDAKVWGSQAVLLYIAEKYSNFQGFGKTPEERAKVESIMSWANGPLIRAVDDTFVSSQLNDAGRLPGHSNQEWVEFGREQTRQQLNVLESHYFASDKKFLVGQEPTFVDYCVCLILSLLDRVRFDLKSYPKTSDWLSDIKQRERLLETDTNGFDSGV